MKKNAIYFQEENYEYLGQIFKTHENRYVKVVEILNKYDVIVEFQDRSKQRARSRMSAVKAGLVSKNCQHTNNAIKFFNMAAQYNGTIWGTLEGYHIRILSYNSKNDVDIEFLETGNMANVRMSSIREGSVKNPFKLNKYGGYFGVGPYTKRQHEKIYKTWMGILIRIDQNNQDNSRNAAYKYASICDEWRNYQAFANWYDNYISRLNPEYYNDYQIDKDILQWKRKYKIYSPNTCCLIPSKLNLALCNHDVERTVEPDLPIGVHRNSSSGNTYMINISMGGKDLYQYQGTFHDPMEAFKKYKELKESYLHSLSKQYYDVNAITKEVYDAVLNINIEPFQTYIDN